MWQAILGIILVLRSETVRQMGGESPVRPPPKAQDP